MVGDNTPGSTITTLPPPSRESKLVWPDGGAVVVPFPESRPPLPLADAEDPDPDAVFDAVVFVAVCDLPVDPDVDFPVADVVLPVDVAEVEVEVEVEDAVLEAVSCLLLIITALFSDESGHGQACVSAEKDAMVARSCEGRILYLTDTKGVQVRPKGKMLVGVASRRDKNDGECRERLLRVVYTSRGTHNVAFSAPNE